MIEGGCNCGAIRYRIEGSPLAIAACHCTRCRRQSGRIYSVNLVVKLSDMAVEGSLESFEDTRSDTGNSVYREFCGDCGSPIRSLLAGSPGIAAVKVGTADDPAALAPAFHVWTSMKLPWVEIPAALPQFERNAG
ncbi:hypothetical protein GCM10011529_27400 [Polymorphobacter glacialis]|uniref:CENP-V/GFA domain-containing protein n=1 Tax=Sandarakinorhabdus glacialis TaxID=1614636 RepID=A0A917A0P8_9SPHN|nr:GFA family protein [Polymorphobacter glacialis]GGE19380.1 hypothetical protein GCM10011529_27400 [Polymorphobacter glacialis]